ncbi:hypothetical protein D3C74_368880 [compost metagenome]
MGARATEGQRAVVLPLDLVQRVEHAVRAVGQDRVLLPVRVLTVLGLGVVAAELDRDLEGGHGADLGLLRTGRGFECGSHQYLRSMGSYRVWVTGLEPSTIL